MNIKTTILTTNFVNQQIEIQKEDVLFFLGIGGIGMSALARYFLAKGCTIYGYDKTRTQLTDELELEGMKIYFIDNECLLPTNIKLVIYTPAIPTNNITLNYIKNNNIALLKRSDVLGDISKKYFSICIGGTHGKTTMSTMLTHVLKNGDANIESIIGGIAANYKTNYIHNSGSDDKIFAILEADEYDKSFLKLLPKVSIISSIDADHLEIYGDIENVQKAFKQFANNTSDDGYVLINYDYREMLKGLDKYIITYSTTNINADITVANIKMNNGISSYDVLINNEVKQHVKLNTSGLHNIENTLPVFYIAHQLNIKKIDESFATYNGVNRRFEKKLSSPLIVIDDYAHHPKELEMIIKAIRDNYKHHKILIVFQPHLYSRTQDLCDDFAKSIAKADSAIILPIYPARELPIEGVNSELIKSKIEAFDAIVANKEKALEMIMELKEKLIDENYIILTAGAGDIDIWSKTLVNKLSN